MEENVLSPFPKMEIRSAPIQKVPKKFEIFPALSYKIQKKVLAPTKKLYVGGVYTTENKNTHTDYRKVVRLGDQKWETIEIICFVWDLYSFTIFHTRSFQVPPEKNNPHLKCQSPHLIPYYKNLLENVPPSPLFPCTSPKWGKGGCKLCVAYTEWFPLKIALQFKFQRLCPLHFCWSVL